MTAPALLLCEVEGPINLGAIARLMDNFDAEELRYTGTLRLEDPLALQFARSGASHLSRATHCPSFDQLVAPFHLLIGFRHGTPWPQAGRLPIAQLGNVTEEALGSGQRVGYLFGNEARGLSNDQLCPCHYVVTLPTSERNTSLNLSHAVALALSEWFRQVRQPKRKEIRHSLTAAERSLLREHWLGFIDSMVFLGEQDAAQRRIALARAMERMPWHPEEYQLLLAAFAKARSRFAALRKEKEQPPQ